MGELDGAGVGCSLGWAVVGVLDGAGVGGKVGLVVGDTEVGLGEMVGFGVGNGVVGIGLIVGKTVGEIVGFFVGGLYLYFRLPLPLYLLFQYCLQLLLFLPFLP